MYKLVKNRDDLIKKLGNFIESAVKFYIMLNYGKSFKKDK